MLCVFPRFYNRYSFFFKSGDQLNHIEVNHDLWWLFGIMVENHLKRNGKEWNRINLFFWSTTGSVQSWSSFPLFGGHSAIFFITSYCCIGGCCWTSGSSPRTSDFNLTNSLATSSFVRWDKIRKIVNPVSSIWILLPRANQQAQEPLFRMSLSCITDTPMRRSSRPKQ